MTQTRAIRQDISRRPDLSIDFDLYLTRATALRRQAMRDGATLKSACVGIVAMVGVLALATFFAAAATRAPSTHAAVAQTHAVPVR